MSKSETGFVCDDRQEMIERDLSDRKTGFGVVYSIRVENEIPRVFETDPSHGCC
jgi:hypothetical protein